MHEPDNIYDKIQELLGNLRGNLTVLEDQIDADIQLEYFNYTRILDKKQTRDDVLKIKDSIFANDMAVEEKKKLIVQLANIDSIEAYRTLERYQGADHTLKDWAKLALQESRLLLESKLLDKSQVLISTGLGGKGLKLRYFTVLLLKNSKVYSGFERKIITSELKFSIKKSGGELEELRFNREFCMILSIIPLNIPVQVLFENLINECNQYGEFLNSDCIITNVRVYSSSMLRKMLRKNRVKNKTRI
jgi:hypothetical protein